MKISLQKRSLRAAGFAIAIALGLAAASHSAQAAIYQYTLSGGLITGSLGGTAFTSQPWSITATASTDKVFFIAAVAGDPEDPFSFSSSAIYYVTLLESAPVITIGTGPSALMATLSDLGIESRDDNITNNIGFSDQNNGGVGQGGMAVVPVSGSGFNNLQSTGTWTSLANSGIDFASNGFSTSSGVLTIPSGPTGTTWGPGTFQISATSTAVPEPGTFLPAAALVMGALLRRRRGRARRSGGTAA